MGLNEHTAGAGHVFDDSRTADNISRKAFPRGARITGYTQDGIETDLEGSGTGMMAWQLAHRRWRQWREVFPAAIVRKPLNLFGWVTPFKAARYALLKHSITGDQEMEVRGDVNQVGYSFFFQEQSPINAIPGGWPVSVMRSSDTDQQAPLAYGAGHPDVMDHRGKIPADYSSWVYDIIDEELDLGQRSPNPYTEAFRAKQHTWGWVALMPKPGDHIKCVQFDGNGAIGWNLRKSAGDLTGWGLFVDRSSGALPPKPPEPPDYGPVTGKKRGRDIAIGPAGNGGSGKTSAGPPPEAEEIPSPPQQFDKNLYGFASHLMKGGINAGAEEDIHYIGHRQNPRTGEIEKFNSGHFSIYLYRNIPGVSPMYDAPMEHDLALWEPASDVGFWYHVHARYDPKDAHQHICDKKPGLWKREVRIPLAPPDWPPPTVPPPRQPPPAVPPPTIPPPPELPEDRGPTTGSGRPISGSNTDETAAERRGQIGSVRDSIVPRGGEVPGVNFGEASFQLAEALADFREEPDPNATFWGKLKAVAGPPPHVGSMYPIDTPGITFTPEPMFGRDMLAPGVNGEWDQYKYAQRPATARMIGIGQCAGPGEWETTNGAGEVYLARATGPGGIMVVPPEYSLANIDSQTLPISDSNFLVHNSMTMGIGDYDCESNTIISGWRWYVDENGDLQFESYDSDGAPASATIYADGAPIGGAGGGITPPGSSTDNAVVRWDGTGADTVQDSVVIIGDTGNITGVAALTMSGTLTANGHVVLGSDGSDNISANGDFITDILPNTDSAYDLGTTARRWADAWIDDLTLTTSLTVGGTATLNGDVVLGSDDADTITFNGDTSGNITPNVDSTDSIGASGVRYLKIWADEITIAGTTINNDMTGLDNLEVTTLADLQGDVNLGSNALDDINFLGQTVGSITPNTDSLDSIGSTSLRYVKGWFDEFAIGNVVFDNSDNITGIDDLTVDGTATLNGAVIIDGDVTLGDTASDNITFNGDTVNDITPNTDSLDSIGSTALRYLKGWFDSFQIGNLAVDTSDNITGIDDMTVDGTATFNGSTVLNGDVALGSDASDTITFNGDTAGEITPNVDSTDSIGSTSLRYLKGWFDSFAIGNIDFDTSDNITGIDDLTADGTATFNGAFIANGNVDLGSDSADTLSLIGSIDTQITFAASLAGFVIGPAQDPSGAGADFAIYGQAAGSATTAGGDVYLYGGGGGATSGAGGDLILSGGEGGGSGANGDVLIGTLYEGLIQLGGAASTVGFYGTTPVAQSSSWNVSNLSPDKTYDCNSTSTAELADILGTLIQELKAIGILDGTITYV